MPANADLIEGEPDGLWLSSFIPQKFLLKVRDNCFMPQTYQDLIAVKFFVLSIAYSSANDKRISAVSSQALKRHASQAAGTICCFLTFLAQQHCATATHDFSFHSNVCAGALHKPSRQFGLIHDTVSTTALHRAKENIACFAIAVILGLCSRLCASAYQHLLFTKSWSQPTRRLL